MHVFNKFARLHVFLSTAKRFRYISLGLQNVWLLLRGLDVNLVIQLSCKYYNIMYKRIECYSPLAPCSSA